jgi:hypothetical protein
MKVEAPGNTTTYLKHVWTMKHLSDVESSKNNYI